MNIYLAAYAPSSPQKLIDLAKLAYSIDIVTGFIVIKPTGMAAQVGLPEVSRMAYKMDKKLIILPTLRDVKDLISVDYMIFIVNNIKDAPDISEIEFNNVNSMCIVVQAGETAFSKEDLALGRIARISEFSVGMSNAVAEATAALLKIYRKVRKI